MTTKTSDIMNIKTLKKQNKTIKTTMEPINIENKKANEPTQHEYNDDTTDLKLVFLTLLTMRFELSMNII